MPACPNPTKPKNSAPGGWLGALVLLATAFLVYAPVWRGGFLWDDDVMLTQNTLIKSSAGLAGIWASTQQPDYFPLTSTTFWLEWRLWGSNATGYHLTNLFLHGLTAILLWRCLRFFKVRGAYAAALVFAVHPVTAASAAWIAERKNTLSAVLALGALLAFFKSEEAGRGKFSARNCYLAALGLFFLALLAKTSVVMLAPALLLLIWWQRGRWTGRDILRTAPFFALALVMGLVTVWFQFHRSMGEKFVDAWTGPEKLAGAGKALWFYMGKAVWPNPLMMIYPQWTATTAISAWLPWGLLLGVGGVAWRARATWGRSVLVTGGWAALMLFPVLGFFPMYYLLYARVADHWQYLALMGFVAGMVGGAAYYFERWRLPVVARRGVATVVIGVLGLLTWQRAAAFTSAENLWRDNLAKNPSAWAAQASLGQILAEKGRHAEAVPFFEAAARLKPDYAESLYNFANTLATLGRTDESVARYEQAIAAKPTYAEAHYNLGFALEKLGRGEEAQAHYQKAAEIKPQHAGAHNNLGRLLGQAGKLEEAAEQFRLALVADPSAADAANNLANIRNFQGRLDEAVTLYETALRLNPAYPEAHFNLGVTLQKLGREAEAKAHFTEAVRLRPNYQEAQEALRVGP